MVKPVARGGTPSCPGPARRGLRWAPAPRTLRDERTVRAARQPDRLESATRESGGQGWSCCHDNPGGRGPRASGLLPGGRQRGGRGRPLSVASAALVPTALRLLQRARQRTGGLLRSAPAAPLQPRCCAAETAQAAAQICALRKLTVALRQDSRVRFARSRLSRRLLAPSLPPLACSTFHPLLFQIVSGGEPCSET